MTLTNLLSAAKPTQPDATKTVDRHAAKPQIACYGSDRELSPAEALYGRLWQFWATPLAGSVAAVAAPSLKFSPATARKSLPHNDLLRLPPASVAAVAEFAFLQTRRKSKKEENQKSVRIQRRLRRKGVGTPQALSRQYVASVADFQVVRRAATDVAVDTPLYGSDLASMSILIISPARLRRGVLSPS